MYKTRIEKLQSSLSKHSIESLLITSPYNIAYLTGILAFSVEEREARILVTGSDAYLFTDARYTEMVRQKSPFVKLIEVMAANPFLKLANEILKNEKVKNIGFEEENITYRETSDLEEKLEGIELIPTIDIVEDRRMIKDENEIDDIKKACQLSDNAFEYIQNIIKPGVTELEIKIKLENYIRAEGGDTSFPSIVAFGKNSAIPHHMSTDSRLKTPDIILLDFGAKVNGYCSDMTRTIFIGKPTDHQVKIYNAVKEAQEIAIDYLKTHREESFETKKAHEVTNSHFGKLGFDDIPHSLGHGVGLQVHENPVLSPYSDTKLENGMIITIEPGVYIPNLGGVRIEDTALVTDDNIEILTHSSKHIVSL